MSTKSNEVDRLARKLRREKDRSRSPGMANRLMAIGARCAELPDCDPRSDDEILGYDDMEASG